MVEAYRLNLGVRFQGRQCADRNGEGDALDHTEPMVQACAKALHSAFLLRLWNLFVLHDDVYSLGGSDRFLVGSLNHGSEVRGELASQPAASQVLGESRLCNQEQQQQAQAFSPGSAVALTASGTLWFQCVQHSSYPSPAQKLCFDSA